MLSPNDFKSIPDWLLGGYWDDIEFKDIEGNVISTKEYGDNKFHGRTHPSVSYMGIMRFTNENDLIYVPFAGSGTEIDVCKKYKRRCIGIDIHPYRDDIIKGDCTEYILNEKAKLIIAHPPYEDVVIYGNEPNNLSKSGKFYDLLVRKSSKCFYTNLDKNGYAIIIVGATFKKGCENPLDYIWYNNMINAGFNLIGRIVRNFGETKSNGNKKNLWKYRLIKNLKFKLCLDYVLIFKK